MGIYAEGFPRAVSCVLEILGGEILCSLPGICGCGIAHPEGSQSGQSPRAQQNAEAVTHRCPSKQNIQAPGAKGAERNGSCQCKERFRMRIIRKFEVLIEERRSKHNQQTDQEKQLGTWPANELYHGRDNPERDCQAWQNRQE